MSNQHTSEEQNKIWLLNLPKKSIAVKVVIWSDKNRVLLVKPTYKKAWQLPGGGVETNEEPKNALTRELEEELGLKIDSTNLKLVDTVFRQEYDNLILMYEYAIRVVENSPLIFQQGELEGFKFEDSSKVTSQLSDYYATFWAIYTDN